jgi:hypothetical protein
MLSLGPFQGRVEQGPDLILVVGKAVSGREIKVDGASCVAMNKPKPFPPFKARRATGSTDEPNDTRTTN